MTVDDAAMPEATPYRIGTGSRTLGLMDVEVDDGTLMLRYRAGDVHAFEILYERHKGPLYRYLKRHCRQRAVADDLFQEVWGRVISARSRYEVKAKFSTFLFRIAHNCTVDYFRRHERERLRSVAGDDIESIAAADTERPDAELATRQLDHALQRALSALPPEQRDVFLLYEESGLSLEEIGEITRVGMETAKSRLRYALAKLRQALSEQRETARGPK